MNRTLRFGALMILGLLALTILSALVVTVAGAQALTDLSCTSTRITRVAVPSATKVFADSIVIDREDRATTRFLCRAKPGKTLPALTCSSARTSRVASPGTVTVFPDSLTFRRVDQDEARALCRPVAPVPPPPPPPVPPPPPPVPPPAPVPPAPPPGAGLVIDEDWTRYPSDSALRVRYMTADRRIWNFGGINWSTVNLVPDPTFGQVLRVTQDAQVPFYNLTTAPSGMPGAVKRVEMRWPAPLEGIWVRFFVRFGVPATNPIGWTTKSPNDPSPYGGSFKVFFLHWAAPYSERGSIVYNNTARLNAEFYVAGLPKVSETLVRGSSILGQGAPEWKDGDWREMVYFYQRTSTTTNRAGAWVRRYTTGGTVAPGPWATFLMDFVHNGPAPLAAYMELGGNKNHGNEFDQWVFWGPVQVRDARQTANPYGVPQ